MNKSLLYIIPGGLITGIFAFSVYWWVKQPKNLPESRDVTKQKKATTKKTNKKQKKKNIKKTNPPDQVKNESRNFKHLSEVKTERGFYESLFLSKLDRWVRNGKIEKAKKFLKKERKNGYSPTERSVFRDYMKNNKLPESIKKEIKKY